MNELSFVFDITPVRVLVIDSETWFVLKDICDVLGIQNSRRVYAEMLDDDEKGVRKAYTPGGEQEMQVVNESGLYTVILRSNSELAKPFRRWVTHDVIPSIRQKGYYSLLPMRELMNQILNELKDDPSAIKLLDTKDEERFRMSLKAATGHDVTSYADWECVRDTFAKTVERRNKQRIFFTTEG